MVVRLMVVQALIALLLGWAPERCWGQAAAKVRSVTLRGNSHFSDRQLRRVMTSAPGWIARKSFHEGTISSDLNAVLAVYEAEGFLKAKVVSRDVVVAGDGVDVDLIIDLEEGPRTLVTRVLIHGAQQLPETALHAAMGLRQGEPFRRQVLLTDRARLDGLYAEGGLIATVIGYEALVDTVGSAHITYHITEGPPVRVSDIVVAGLDKTKPHVVLREVKIAVGDLFQRSRLEKTQTAVFSTGLFRSVTVGPASGAAEDSARALLVTVRERRAGSLDVGFGYGSSERLRAGLSLAQTNWMSRALRIGANARASRLVRTIEGVFTVPYIGGRHVALDGRLFHEWERNQEAAFRTQGTGMEETLSYQWRNSWVSEMSHTLERVRLRSDGADIYQPARTASSVSLGLRRDSRDNPLDTRAGSMLRARADVAGGLLGGSSDFNRSTVEVLHFRPVWFAVIALHAQASAIEASGAASRVAKYEQFYLGGDHSVRGYGRGEIGADRVGELAFNAQLELRVPVLGHSLVLFHDAGQVWQEAVDVDIPADLRRATGAGVRYVSRFGMLRLDVAVADKPGNLGDRLGLYFGVGQSF